MPFGGLLTGGISALSGFLGGGKQQQQNTNSTTNQSQSGTTSGATNQNLTNNLSPFQQQLASLFTKGATNLYNDSTNLQPYEASGIQQINQNAGLQNQVLQNNLASRGLTYSPAAGAATNQASLARGGQVSQFENSIPLLQRQMQQQSLSGLVSAFSALPTDKSTTGTSSGSTSSSGTSTTNGTQSTFGNPAAGAVGGLGAGLAAGGFLDGGNPFSSSNGSTPVSPPSGYGLGVGPFG